MRKSLLLCLLISPCLFLLGADKAADFAPLFSQDGVPKGWSARTWDDVKNPGPKGAEWKVQDGVLHGSEPRGDVADAGMANCAVIDGMRGITGPPRR